jgi:hypothetical protein
MRIAYRVGTAAVLGLGVCTLPGCANPYDGLFGPIRESDVVPLHISMASNGDLRVSYLLCAGSESSEVFVFGKGDDSHESEVVHALRESVPQTFEVVADITSESLARGSITSDLPVDDARTFAFEQGAVVSQDVRGILVKLDGKWTEVWFEDIDWSQGDDWLKAVDGNGGMQPRAWDEDTAEVFENSCPDE